MNSIEEFQQKIEEEAREKIKIRRILHAILAVHLAFQILSVIGSAVNINNIECKFDLNKLSCAIWLLIFTIANIIANALFMLFDHFCHKDHNKGNAGTVPMGDFFFICFCGIPMALLIIILLLFQIGWFIYGAIILSNLSFPCGINQSLLYGLSITELILTILMVTIFRFAYWKSAA